MDVKQNVNKPARALNPFFKASLSSASWVRKPVNIPCACYCPVPTNIKAQAAMMIGCPITGGSCHECHFCRDKTRQTRVCRDKTRLLSRQKHTCFNFCRDKIFSRDKHVHYTFRTTKDLFCCDKHVLTLCCLSEMGQP